MLAWAGPIADGRAARGARSCTWRRWRASCPRRRPGDVGFRRAHAAGARAALGRAGRRGRAARPPEHGAGAVRRACDAIVLSRQERAAVRAGLDAGAPSGALVAVTAGPAETLLLGAEERAAAGRGAPGRAAGRRPRRGRRVRGGVLRRAGRRVRCRTVRRAARRRGGGRAARPGAGPAAIGARARDRGSGRRAPLREQLASSSAASTLIAPCRRPAPRAAGCRRRAPSRRARPRAAAPPRDPAASGSTDRSRPALYVLPISPTGKLALAGRSARSPPRSARRAASAPRREQLARDRVAAVGDARRSRRRTPRSRPWSAASSRRAPRPPRRCRQPKNSHAASLSAVSGPEASRSRSAARIDSEPSQ